jgi:hypothetical protein
LLDEVFEELQVELNKCIEVAEEKLANDSSNQREIYHTQISTFLHVKHMLLDKQLELKTKK